jgi:acetolactate decarboxylase
MADRILQALTLTTALVWAGCKNAGEPAPAQQAQAVQQQAAPTPASSNPVEIKTYGALRGIFHMGETGPQVKLSEVAGPDVQGVGALSESRGEVTIVDGTFWLAYPDGKGGARVERTQQSDEQAMLLVTASNKQWRRVTLEEDIDDANLDAKLEAIAVAQGIDVTKPFPLRVEGPIANVKWHVLDGSKATAQPAKSHEDHMRMAVTGTVPQTEGTVVGFFSKQHHGVFTHMGSNSHLHVVLAKEGISGHVDGITLKKGAALLLPQ